MLATTLDCMLRALTAHLLSLKSLSIFNILKREQVTFLGAGSGEVSACSSLQSLTFQNLTFYSLY